jgi:hypothetical protein
MKNVSSLAGGVAGAAALTILHELMRKNVAGAPRMDRMGIEATAKLFRKVNLQPPSEKKLFLYSMAGDIIGNSLYYSRIASGTKKQVWMNGAMLGLTAGLSAVYLPGKIGLNEANSNRSTKTQLLTIGLYLVGGLVAAAATNLLRDKKQNKVPGLKKFNAM